jgi:hypothetical protein
MTTKSINIYYQDLPVKQVSVDEKTWISVSGYNQHNQPYFNLNDTQDWCSIETSKSGEWLVCFVKLQNDGDPIYYRGFIPTNQFEPIFIFECFETIKDIISGKWIKKN